MHMLEEFKSKIDRRDFVVGIIGLGYVGLPLSITFARKGFKVLGLDIDPQKPKMLNAGKSYLRHIHSSSLKPYIHEGRFFATTDFSKATDCDALLICVPTPLTESHEPDLSYVKNTTEAISGFIRCGQLVALESTTYPGTTDELVCPILESNSGLQAGNEFFLAYSPEREDPGNTEFSTSNIPKVVGGHTEGCLEAGLALYGAVIDKVVPVSSTRVAEMVKLFENIYRAVNIALVNELKLLCHRLDMDTWEIIRAAATKPFGFQSFWPGPGLGGHCIPIDPFYLSWKARQVDMSTRFIELAGEINTSMPYYVVSRVQEALNRRRKSLNGSSILVIGVAYKPNVDDMRESPALKIIDVLINTGARVLYHDPHVPELTRTRRYNFDLKSAPLSVDLLKTADCVLVVTDHSEVDYQLIAETAEVIVDTRHVVPRHRKNVIDG